VGWLNGLQNADGGWGESNDGYNNRSNANAPSTPYHTAWALLGLLAAGEAASETVRRGVNHLMRTQQSDGLWSDPTFTPRPASRGVFLPQVPRLLPLLPAVGPRRLSNADPGRNHPLTVAGVVAALESRGAHTGSFG